MSFKTSLVIATYNWPSALELTLKSVNNQVLPPSEIVVADDGSKDDTKALVDEFKKQTNIPIIHVWQPDEGFQLAKIRNRAFAAAHHPYIIQIDGDLILHRNFIADHIRIARPKHFVSGSRVLLSQQTAAALLREKSIDVNHTVSENKNYLNGLRSPFLSKMLAPVYKTSGKNKYYVKGCNMAFWKEDLLKVNGYNEEFLGWGKEDSEIAIRLINAGIKKLFLKFGGISYHLYHKEASRDLEDRNVAIMNRTIADKLIWANKGIQQYL